MQLLGIMTPPRRKNAPNASMPPRERAFLRSGRLVQILAKSENLHAAFLCPRTLNNPLPGAPSSSLDAQRFRLSGARTRRNPRALIAAYHEGIHHDQSNLIPLDPEAFIR
jgi:hypothetical protein